MRVVEHTLHRRHRVDVVVCDGCGLVADADAAAAWVHLGPLVTAEGVDAVDLDGLDFCSAACAAERLRAIAEAPPAPLAPA